MVLTASRTPPLPVTVPNGDMMTVLPSALGRPTSMPLGTPTPRAPDIVILIPDTVCVWTPLETVIVPGRLEETDTPPAPSGIWKVFTPSEMVTVRGGGLAIGW